MLIEVTWQGMDRDSGRHSTRERRLAQSGGGGGTLEREGVTNRLWKQ